MPYVSGQRDPALPPISSLVAAAEALFSIPEGSLLAPTRYHPILSFRNLVTLVALERGHLTKFIAEDLDRPLESVRKDIRKARRAVASGDPWWLNTKADLVDAWEDAQC